MNYTKIRHSNQIENLSFSLPVTDSVRATFRAIVSHASKKSGKWTCYPSVSRLASIVGLSERQVKRHTRTLSDLGVIAKKANHYVCKRTNQARQTNNTYIINLFKIMALFNSEQARKKVSPKHVTALNPLPKNKKDRIFLSKKKAHPAVVAFYSYLNSQNLEFEKRLAITEATKTGKSKSLGIISKLKASLF